MIKQKGWRGGDKSEHVYSEDKSNMQSRGVSMKINQYYEMIDNCQIVFFLSRFESL
jgi:hypothetical protein